MMRTVGAALLAAGAAEVGFGAAASLEWRVRDLRGFLIGLAAMRQVLDARLAPLDEMLSAACEATGGRPREVFSHCLEGLEGDGRQSFCCVWNTALEELPLRLDQADLEVLRPLGGVLGRCDGDSQSDSLALAITRLEGQLSQAAVRRDTMGRVYGTVGVSVGLFLAIMLI